MEKVGQANFSTIFVTLKTSSEIAGKLAGSRFPRVMDGNVSQSIISIHFGG